MLTFGRRGCGGPCATGSRRGSPGRAAASCTSRWSAPSTRTRSACSGGPPPSAANPSPRLLTGPEQDLIIRELLAVVGDRGHDAVRWPDALRPALATRAFAQQLRDLMQRAAERGVGPVELARLGERLGRDDWPAAARFMREYVAVLALRDATTRGSTAYDPAELVRAASGLLADDPGPARRRAPPARLRLRGRAGRHRPGPDRAAVAGRRRWGAAGRVRRPGLLGVRGFRGADPQAVQSFPVRFRTAVRGPGRDVTLHTSYRAEPALLGATGRVARRMRGRVTHRAMHPPALADSPGDGSGRSAGQRRFRIQR